MKTILIFSAFIIYGSTSSAQKTDNTRESLLKELALNSCNCVDSVITYVRPQTEVSKDIAACINKQAAAYQTGAKAFEALEQIKEGKKNITINVAVNENSNEYKKYYYELESYMIDHCNSLKTKVASNDKQNKNSFSENQEAVDLYNMGIDKAQNNDHKKAIFYFLKALKVDSLFAFAWDNLGVSYRNLNEFDKAIAAYNKSLQLDPKGMLPLQNIAVVYIFQKRYSEAIQAYEQLKELDKNNPEIYYGIGNIYVTYMAEYEKGLENLCKAYNIYIEMKSPYRSDAEKLINQVYSEMKKQGKEQRFNEILKLNNISTQ